MYNSYPFSSYIPLSRSVTGALTGGDVLTITSGGNSFTSNNIGTAQKKGFLCYTTSTLYAEISNGILGTAATPALGSLQIPASTYNFIVPIQPGSEIKLKPINSTAYYSVVFLS